MFSPHFSRLFLAGLLVASGMGCAVFKGFKKADEKESERVLEVGASYGVEDEVEFYNLVSESAEAERILGKGEEVVYLGPGSDPRLAFVQLMGGEEGEIASAALSQDVLKAAPELEPEALYAEESLPNEFQDPGPTPKIPKIRLDDLRGIAPRPVGPAPTVPPPPQF